MSAVLQEAKAVISVYKTARKRCTLEQAAGRGEGRRVITTLRWGEERERIQNKFNLPRSPSPKQPSLFSLFSFFLYFGSAQWACFVLLCQTQGGHREELKWRRTGRWGEAVVQGEQWTCYWGRFNSEVPTKKKKKCHWHTSRANDFRGGCWPSVFNSGLALRRDGAVLRFPLLH